MWKVLLLCFILLNSSSSAPSAQTLGFSYELDDPSSGIKYRGRQSPAASTQRMQNMFMPAVRMNRMIQELTSRMMNMFANVPEAGALH